MLRINENDPIEYYTMKSLLKWAMLSLTAGALSSCSPRGPSNLPSTGQPYGPPPGYGGAGGLGSSGAGQTPYSAPGSGGTGQSPYSAQGFGGAGQYPSYGAPGSGRSDNTYPYSNSASLDSDRDNAFLYNLTPDTITALTCPQHQNIGSQPLTLTAGAYYSRGLLLSDDFIDSHSIKNGDPPQKIRQLIDRSPFRRARASLALHDESDINQMMTTAGNPIRSIFPRFDNVVSLDLLSQLQPVFTSRSPNRSGVQNSGPFRASLPLSGGQLVAWAPDLAPGTSGKALLALTYTLNGKSLIFSSNRRPYGRSYKLDFSDPYQANYMRDIQEENLETTQREGRWDCPEYLKFMVHRAASQKDSHFNRAYDQYKSNSQMPQDLLQEGFCQTGRRPTGAEADFFRREFGFARSEQLPFEVGNTIVYRPDNGFVNTGQPCIKFKTPGCYAGGGFYRIEFDPEKVNNCQRNHLIENRHFSNPEFYKICPAYLSVCYRDLRTSD